MDNIGERVAALEERVEEQSMRIDDVRALAAIAGVITALVR